MNRLTPIERFDQSVRSRFQIYNSIFLTLPFDTVKDTGVLLPLFQQCCQEGFAQKLDPTAIVDRFFKQYQKDQLSDEQKHDLLFRFIRYIERQVVLFDAIEDASFASVYNLEGRGTLRSIKEAATSKGQLPQLRAYLKHFKVRPTLTAHPTQFYPGSVLGIITDLDQAIQQNDLNQIKDLLAQLGRTPFFNKSKPTPYNEAVSLIWYLQNVFYKVAGSIYNYVQEHIFEGEDFDNDLINLGFWPGGDRDGNPFVTTEITLKVARRLKKTILLNYYKDLRKLKRRITFGDLHERLTTLEHTLYDAVHSSEVRKTYQVSDLLDELLSIRAVLKEDFQSLFLKQLQDLINKVKLFGVHFATLDIRQDSSVHHLVFQALIDKGYFPLNYKERSTEEKIKLLHEFNRTLDPEVFSQEIVRKTLGSIYAMKTIQKENGEQGVHRYITSNTQSTEDLMQVFTLLRSCNWEDGLSVDVVPLFETVPDLKNAPQIMEFLYNDPIYKAHLERRGNKQTVMLGFSDGTKDGGYLMANWAIFQAKETLTALSRKYDITVIFFDGRGGPPARGGGNTSKFFASLGDTIENQEIQMTVQGQTISSKFGTTHSCQYNLEQLLGAGVTNELSQHQKTVFSQEDRKIMQRLSDLSYQAYTDFKKHPKFLSYIEQMSTLQYYGKTNIGSRPSKRNSGGKLNFSDLRAIPFVGSWSQLKQNVPGFYGVGTAIAVYEKEGELDKVKQLYQDSPFFKALIDNSIMSISKSFFELTMYMKDDPEYGAFWQLIYDEYLLSKRLLLEITQTSHLMENEPIQSASIRVREQIVLPLLTIQQFALCKIQQIKASSSIDQQALEVYEKMVTRSLFGNINASRNSA